MKITKAFVARWASRYDKDYGAKYREAEADVHESLRSITKTSGLNKFQFLKICDWKSERQKGRYRANAESLVIEATRLARVAKSDRLKLHVLTSLEGVGVPVASTILYVLDPENLPIFDVRARNALDAAGLWRRNLSDASSAAWLDYIAIVRDLATTLGVSLRDIDKALWAYDKAQTVT